jgi:carbon dioxide concentrating mechanism protein CcmM
MAVSTGAARNLVEPQIHDTAFVHSFASVVGDVTVGECALVAAGTAVRADEGGKFFLGGGTTLQEGAIVHALEKGVVVGDDGEEYAVWIGDRSTIGHLSLIHGPAYIGSDCFVGFRSTVFNARLGEGCIVMMHALVQDVEIAAGRYVPSGSIVTTQAQADALPVATDRERNFCRQVIGTNAALRASYVAAAPANNHSLTPSISTPSVASGDSSSGSAMALTPDVLDRVRGLLAQGALLGIEHANQRRFRANAWSSGGTIAATSFQRAISELASLVAEHEGEYVRLIGIDPQAKSRLLEVTIQRPGEEVNISAAATATSASSNVSSFSSPGASAGSDLGEMVRTLLNRGCRIGLEYADRRRFSSNAWNSAESIQGTQFSTVMSQLEAFLTEHEGQYVRLIGVDTATRSRVLEQIVQRPEGRVVAAASSSNGSTPSLASSNGAAKSTSFSGGASGDIAQTVKELLSQGYKVGTEHADPRRFRVGSWHSCSPIESTNSREVIAALESCFQEHAGEYVRLIGIDTQQRRRVYEAIVQKP